MNKLRLQIRKVDLCNQFRLGKRWLCYVSSGLVICEITIVIFIICFLISCFSQAMANAASPAYILETRKTAPCLRLLDKWAVCTLNHFLDFINDHLFVFLYIKISQ